MSNLYPAPGELHKQLGIALVDLRIKLELLEPLHILQGFPVGVTALSAMADDSAGFWPTATIVEDSESLTAPSLAAATNEKSSVVQRGAVTGENLSLIGESIQLLSQTCQLTTQIPHAIFTSWFVDFEPVKAKAAAAARWRSLQPASDAASPVCYLGEVDPQYQLPDLQTYCDIAAMSVISAQSRFGLRQFQQSDPVRYAQLHAIAAQFPATMRDSELGPVPDGWRVGTVDELFEVSDRQIANTRKQTDAVFSQHGHFAARPPYPQALVHFCMAEPSLRTRLERVLADPLAPTQIPWLIYPLDLIEAFNSLFKHYSQLTRQLSQQAGALERFRQPHLSHGLTPP